jgi:hypothetical protein
MNQKQFQEQYIIERIPLPNNLATWNAHTKAVNVLSIALQARSPLIKPMAVEIAQDAFFSLINWQNDYAIAVRTQNQLIAPSKFATINMLALCASVLQPHTLPRTQIRQLATNLQIPHQYETTLSMIEQEQIRQGKI